MDEVIVGGSAWSSIDAATFKASGDMAAIKECMENALTSKSVDNLCKELGVLVSSFAFRNEAQKKTVFYRAGDPDPDTYHTNYLLTNHKDRSDYGNFLHDLFVRIRTINEDVAEAGFRPDYELHAPLTEDEKDARARYDGEREYRRRHLVHYCTLGETILTCLVWRRLSTLVESGRGAEPIASGKLCLTASTATHVKICHWQSVDLLRAPALQPDFTNKLTELWGKRFGPMGLWQDEWSQIGLGIEDEGWAWKPVLTFLNIIGIEISESSTKELNDVLDQHSVQIINCLLGSRFSTDLSHSEALGAIETKSRFPLLPFYAWIALDSAPRVFCVSPVWLSQSLKHNFPDVRTRMLGYAVSGVTPMQALDWTLTDDWRWKVDFSNDKHPQLVFSILRLMAKPLVEAMLYQWAIDAALDTSEGFTAVKDRQ